MGKLFSKIKKMHEEIHPLDSSEQSALLNISRKESVRDYYFFLTALHTGMRPGELAALDWSEVDFENKLIHVRFNLTKNGKREQPKTKSSIRDIHLSDILVRELREWKRAGPPKFVSHVQLHNLYEAVASYFTAEEVKLDSQFAYPSAADNVLCVLFLLPPNLLRSCPG